LDKALLLLACSCDMSVGTEASDLAEDGHFCCGPSQLMKESSVVIDCFVCLIFICSVRRNIITNYSQQDATFLEFISSDPLHFSGGSSAHHQEHITVHTASGIVNM
jgi:hypothetical protein